MFYKLRACWWLKMTTINVLITNISHTVTGKTRHVGEDVHPLHQDQWSHILSRRSGSLLLRIVGNESLAMLMFMGEELNWSFQYVRTCRWTSVCASAIKPSICCTVTLHFRRHATSLKLPVVFHIGFTHQPFKLSHFFLILAFCFFNLGNGIMSPENVSKRLSKNLLIIAFAHLLDWL